MAQFAAYSSIENHYRDAFMNEVTDFLGDDIQTTQFVCTEKIHGANFQFYAWEEEVDGEQVVQLAVGKRKSLLGPTDRFFPGSVPEIREKYDDNVRDLFRHCKAEIPTLQSLVLYGELYGCGYPGFRAAHKPVQKQILYCPHYDFFPFDLRLIIARDEPEEAEADGEAEAEEQRGTFRRFLPYEAFAEKMEESGFEIYAKPLITGTLTECLAYDIAIQSTLPALHGLDTSVFPEGTNLIEGVVIRPLSTELFLPRHGRLLIKFKSSAFTEVAPRKARQPKQASDIPEAVQERWDDMERYVNETRLDSVISKIGEVSRRDTGRLIGLLNKDVLDEYEKMNPGWERLFEERDHVKMVRKMLGRGSAAVVNGFFRRQQLQQ